MSERDVVVLGGGLTGLAFARLLAGATAATARPLSITVVDAAPAPAAPVAGDDLSLRVIALSPASLRILARCDAWPPAEPARVGHCRRMVVWQGQGAPPTGGTLHFDAAEVGRADLMVVAETDRLRQALWRSCASHAGIELMADIAPERVDVAADGVTVALADGRELRSRLVVGAEGHDSWLRRALGVPVDAHDYGQSALVAHVSGERPHADTAWQCFLPDGPLALLPLGDGRSSIVWSTARAGELAAKSEAAFEDELTAASGGVRGDLALTTGRHAIPLAALHAGHYTGMRYALIGDAAHRIHPLAGQGANLGIADAEALATAIAEHAARAFADPGDPLALRRYERWRKAANLTTLSAMDAFHAVFTSRAPGVARVAGRAFGLVDRIGPLKRAFAREAMGIDQRPGPGLP